MQNETDADPLCSSATGQASPDGRVPQLKGGFDNERFSVCEMSLVVIFAVWMLVGGSS